MGSKIKVCVIGAGSSGLATVAELLTHSEKFDVIGFEKTALVGGEWNYSADNSFVDGERPNAMYNSLRTNSDKFCSVFPGYDFPEDVPVWPTKDHILKYISDFADTFNLREFYKFNTKVDKISTTDEGKTWTVEWSNVLTQDKNKGLFDSVVVCTGIFHKPIFPDGYENFEGYKIHSCQYREPSALTGKKVLIIGAGASCVDISLEISKVASKVKVSSKNTLLFDSFPSNLEHTKLVKLYHKNSVTFENGEEERFDAVVLCTGFRPCYPFLDDSCQIEITPDGLVYPLFLNIVHTKLTTLFFSGMNYIDAHIPNVAFTAQFIVNVLKGEANLPSEELMKKDIDDKVQNLIDSGKSVRELFKLGTMQQHWMNEVGRYGNLQNVPRYPSFDEIVKIILSSKFNRLREYDFIMEKDGSVTVIPPEK